MSDQSHDEAPFRSGSTVARVLRESRGYQLLVAAAVATVVLAVLVVTVPFPSSRVSVGMDAAIDYADQYAPVRGASLRYRNDAGSVHVYEVELEGRDPVDVLYTSDGVVLNLSEVLARIEPAGLGPRRARRASADSPGSSLDRRAAELVSGGAGASQQGEQELTEREREFKEQARAEAIREAEKRVEEFREEMRERLEEQIAARQQAEVHAPQEKQPTRDPSPAREDGKPAREAVAKMFERIVEQDEWTITYRADNETDEVIVFTDWTCPFCQQLHENMDALNAEGLTVHYLWMPRALGHGEDHPDAQRVVTQMRNVMCHEDVKQANDRVHRGETVSDAHCTDEQKARYVSEIKEHYVLANMLGLEGTPFTVLRNGETFAGFGSTPQYLDAIETMQ